MALDPVVEIIRLEESEQGTFGVLRLNKAVTCLTLEPQDRLNERNVSSIPAQQYRCRRRKSQRFGDTFEVSDVPGRTDVLFHSGNTEKDTQGCILLGRKWGEVSGQRAVTESRSAFKSFMQALGDYESFSLTIYEQY